VRTLLALVATALVAWWLGRDYEWRNGECACQDEDDEMAFVQPSDPWPPVRPQSSDGIEWRRFDFLGGSSIRVAEPMGWTSSTYPENSTVSDTFDPTYADAYTHAVIRNTSQSTDAPLGGM
jgi:hypothetical protein